MTENGVQTLQDEGIDVFTDVIPGLIPGANHYEEMRVPSAGDASTRWKVHFSEGGSEDVPGTFTFRISTGCIIFHQWGEQLDADGRRERKARFVFPLEKVKFVARTDD